MFRELLSEVPVLGKKKKKACLKVLLCIHFMDQFYHHKTNYAPIWQRAKFNQSASWHL